MLAIVFKILHDNDFSNKRHIYKTIWRRNLILYAKFCIRNSIQHNRKNSKFCEQKSKLTKQNYNNKWSLLRISWRLHQRQCSQWSQCLYFFLHQSSHLLHQSKQRKQWSQYLHFLQHFHHEMNQHWCSHHLLFFQKWFRKIHFSIFASRFQDIRNSISLSKICSKCSMKHSKKQIFFISNITSRTMRIFETFFFFIKSRSRFISDLQSIRTSLLVKSRKLQIREIFISVCSRNRFASNFYLLSKSRQKNRKFCHTKCFSSLTTYLLHFSIQITHSIMISDFAINESDFNKSINQKSLIIKNAMIRSRNAYLLSKTLIVRFRKFSFASRFSIFIHVDVAFEFFAQTTICMSIFVAFIWNIVIVVSSNVFFSINVWISFEKKSKQYFSHRAQFTEIFESMNEKFDEFLVSLHVLLIDFSWMNRMFSSRDTTKTLWFFSFDDICYDKFAHNRVEVVISWSEKINALTIWFIFRILFSR